MRVRKALLLAVLAALPWTLLLSGSAPGGTGGRAARALHADPPAATATLLPARVSATTVASPATASADPEAELVQAAAAALRRNLYPRLPVLYPSPAYYNPYLRDSFWAALSLRDRRFSTRVLATFAAAERADGDPPTLFVNAYRHPRYHDDESAALLLIWAWYNRVRYGVTPPRAALAHALAYLLGRAHGGFLVSPRGPYGSWWDVYSLPAPDTFSYVQGLYAVALRCAARLGLAPPAGTLVAAGRAYRALYDPRLGYLTLSRHIPASDASALTGEFLSLWLFGRPLLSDAVVLRTVHHLAPFGAGFHVVALPGARPGQGTTFAPDPYIGAPGDYQNGASWLLFDALSIGAAGLHGLPNALPWLRARLALEFKHGVMLHEYLRTNATLSYYGSAPAYRDQFAWDAFVVVIDGVLRARAGPG